MNAQLAYVPPNPRDAAARRRRAHGMLMRWGEWFQHDGQALGYPSASSLAHIRKKEPPPERDPSRPSNPTLEAAARHEKFIGLTNVLSSLESPWARMIVARYVLYPSPGQTPEIMLYMRLDRSRVYSRLADIHEWLADKLGL